MNWIKLTPETKLPKGKEVLTRCFDGLFTYYHVGFSTGNMIAIEPTKFEKHLTHFALIEEPEDVVKEEVKELSEEDKDSLPFDS